MFDRPWPDDLRGWYSIQDGVGNGDLIDTPLPHWTLRSLQSVVSDTDFYRSMYEDEGLADEELAAEEDAEPAGSRAFVWLPSFVLIAHDVTACGLYVDLRPGEQYGCVSMWDRDTGGADEEGPLWGSVTAMLEATATSLESGTPCNGYVPVVEDGALGWDYELG